MKLLELGLATWRLSRMLVQEAGPFDVFTHLRLRTGVQYDSRGNLFSWPDWNPLYCVYCTSIYAAVLLAVAPKWVRLPLAASGAAALIEDVLSK